LNVGGETQVVLFLALLLAACGGSVTELHDAAVPLDGGSHDAIVFESCSSICLRPSDCAIAYPDGDICPPGFECATRFSCDSDGGGTD
jgi:hypothetical protein